jgi:hypothetical protein
MTRSTTFYFLHALSMSVFERHEVVLWFPGQGCHYHNVLELMTRFYWQLLGTYGTFPCPFHNTRRILGDTRMIVGGPTELAFDIQRTGNRSHSRQETLVHRSGFQTKTSHLGLHTSHISCHFFPLCLRSRCCCHPRGRSKFSRGPKARPSPSRDGALRADITRHGLRF